MRLNEHDLIGLRRLADDAQRDGDPDTAAQLNELLDSHETLLEAEEALEITDGPEDVVTACETVTKAIAGLDDGDHDAVIEACSKFDDLKKAVELAADETSAETENLEDVKLSVEAEIDKLKELVPGLMPVGGYPQRFEEIIAGLEDAVSTLEGMRKRLTDTAKRAREVRL